MYQFTMTFTESETLPPVAVIVMIKPRGEEQPVVMKLAATNNINVKTNKTLRRRIGQIRNPSAMPPANLVHSGTPRPSAACTPALESFTETVTGVPPGMTVTGEKVHVSSEGNPEQANEIC